MDFKQCKVLADIKYCEATNVEYEQYYKDNYDSNFELTEPDTEYDGYIVSIRTLTGFESHGLSSCVDPSRYDVNIGKKFAKEKAIDAIWAGLGFVLQ